MLGLGKNPDRNAEMLMFMLFSSIGVPHTYDLYFLFNTRNNPENEVVSFQEPDIRVAMAMQTFWSNFVWRLDPNSQEGDEYQLPEWPPFKVAKSGFNTNVTRIRDPPTTRAPTSDIEVSTWVRCSWYRRHVNVLRARSQPWQTIENVRQLGHRCCCNMDIQPVQCMRLEDLNWRGRCPMVDLGSSRFQTHHAPLGCVADNPDVVLRCCCVRSKETGRQSCQRLANSKLKRGAVCPRICVDEQDDFTSCHTPGSKTRQSHHVPYGCDSDV